MTRAGALSLWTVLSLCSTALPAAAQPTQESPPAGEEAGASAAPNAEPSAEVVELDTEDAEQSAGVAQVARGELAPDTKSDGMQAYQKALEAKKLSASIPLSRARLQEELRRIESKLVDGRHDEAIGDLVYIVESARFGAFRESTEGRAAGYLLGNSLGGMGATQLARGYLVPLLAGNANGTWTRRAIRSLVDLGLNSDEPQLFLRDLHPVARAAPEELLGDIAYLKGRVKEREKKRAE